MRLEIGSSHLFILLKFKNLSNDMRAVVLLCLLHVAFGEVTYSWHGPGYVEPITDPNQGNACQTDEGSCGCCLMLQKLNQMKMYFNMSLNKMEQEYKQTHKSLKKIEASRTAFSVALYNGSRYNFYGPSNLDSVVIYTHVFLNLGNCYNPDTGIFTVPQSGVYSLALTVYSDAGAFNSRLAACVGLQVNGKMVAGSTDKNRNDQEDSSSIVVALHLMTGDKVCVNLPAGCFLYDDFSHYNTFSAFLLYATEWREE